LALAALALNLSLIQSGQCLVFHQYRLAEHPREFHTATLLSNGKGLVRGAAANNLFFSPGRLYASAYRLMEQPPVRWAPPGFSTPANLCRMAGVLVAAGKLSYGGGH